MCAEDGYALRAALTDYAQVPVPVLCDLLLLHWHDLHEDIAFELGLIGDPIAVDTILRAASIRFESLVEWGNLAAFQRKCAYALARIATEDSRLALEMLAKSDDPQLCEYALEGIAHWPLPYRKA
jgi:HEAT repeat protein